eukprot:TRINITY_DN9004_c1_g5_i1.p1 TRINITY_DN9004_c1_g5~~TRINITY_DN9004_c1_g5_i1.p1  ORF type:complete len:1042 (+),score=301.17 TRINITY_DN9004_c1_g5_i1:79-3204(+)
MPPKKGKGEAEAEVEPPKPPPKWEVDMELAWNAAQDNGPASVSTLLAIAPPPPRPQSPRQGISGPQAMLLHAQWCEYYYSVKLRRATYRLPEAAAKEEEDALRYMRFLSGARGLTPHDRAIIRCKEEAERDRHFPRHLRPVALRGLRAHYSFDMLSEVFWADRLKGEEALRRNLAESGLGRLLPALCRAGIRIGDAQNLPQRKLDQLGVTEHAEKQRLLAVLAGEGATSRRRRHRLCSPPPSPRRQVPADPDPGPDPGSPSCPADDAAPCYVALGSPRCGMPGLSVYDYSRVDSMAQQPLPEGVAGDVAQVARHVAADFRELAWRNNAEQRAHHTVRALFVWTAVHIAPAACDAKNEGPAAALAQGKAGSAGFAALLREMCYAALNDTLSITLPTRAAAAMAYRDTWEGAAVADVPVDGMAIKRGVRPGMLLTKVGGQAVGSVQSARDAFAAAGADCEFVFVRSAGVRIDIIEGRGTGTFGPSGEPIPGPARHWLLVTWPSRLRSLVDPWGAAGGGLQQRPARLPVGWHWCTPPAQFLSTHFPAPVPPPASAAAPAKGQKQQRPPTPPAPVVDEAAQLLRCPTALTAWEMRPPVTAAFYDHGLSLLSHTRARVMAKAPPLVFEIGMRDAGIELRARLTRGTLRTADRQPMPPGFVFESRSFSLGVAYFAVVPTEPGEYVLEVSARRPPHPVVIAQEAAGTLPPHVRPPPFEPVVAYQVVSTAKVCDDALLPRQCAPPMLAQLAEPLYSKLEQAQPQTFSVVPTHPSVEGALVLCRERPREAGGSAKSRASAAPSSARSTSEDKPDKKGKGKGKSPAAAASAEEPPAQPAAPLPEQDWPVSCHVLAFKAGHGMYEGLLPSLKRGVVEVYVRLAGRFFLLATGISVVRQVPSNERELNGGRPLVVQVGSAEERAATLTRLTYLEAPAPVPPAVLGPDAGSPLRAPAPAAAPAGEAPAEPEVELPPCRSPPPPRDGPRRLFEQGAANPVGGYWAEREERREAEADCAPPPRAVSSLSRPFMGRLGRVGSARTRPISAATRPSPR